jgi:FkbM family methyltransferase
MSLISYFKTLVKKDHTFVSGSSIRWFGTTYGGFYLDESLLTASSALFSFGVGEDISFDIAVSKKNIGSVFLFDPTPKSIAFIKNTRLPDNFQFHPIGISDKDEQANFFLPKNNNNVSGSLLAHKQVDSTKEIKVSLKKLSTILHELDVHRVDVLKVDIEGSEYRVLKNIIEERIFPLQICVEFHNEFHKNGKLLFRNCLNLLKENGYEIKATSGSGKEYLLVHTPNRKCIEIN